MKVADSRATVRIHNTNTRKIIHSSFEVRDGQAVDTGDFAIPGVAGTGAPIKLEFLEPGGAITGKLLPTGDVIEELDVPGVGRIDVSMVDAANACVFVRAESLGLTGTETPEQIEHDPRLMEALLLCTLTKVFPMSKVFSGTLICIRCSDHEWIGAFTQNQLPKESFWPIITLSPLIFWPKEHNPLTGSSLKQIPEAGRMFTVMPGGPKLGSK